MLKSVLEKLFNVKQKQAPSNEQNISYDQVQAIVDARMKEHAASLQTVAIPEVKPKPDHDEENYKLTEKQIIFALSLIEKVNNEFELAIDSAELTVKDLNRLIAYNRYKNKGTLINLVKKGVLKRK